MRSILSPKLLCGVVLLASAAAMGQSTQPAARTGDFAVTFTEQDPRSPIDAQHDRYHIAIADLQRYTLAEHSFQAYVPETYDGDTPYGIMVMVSAGNRGNMPRGWQGLMDKHNLIYVGANDSGNQRGVAVRFGLAMDAVHNLREQYNIDEARVYVTGNSGGGKIASMLGVLYPEIFQGSAPIVGVSYFVAIPLPDDPTRGWAASYNRPSLHTYNLAKSQTRFVLITGTNDMNRDSIKGTYERGFLKDGFQYVDYVEVQGMGHSMPPADVMDKAIETLDAPLAALARGYFDRAQLLDRQKKYDQAARAYQQAAIHGTGPLAGEAAAKAALAEQRAADQAARLAAQPEPQTPDEPAATDSALDDEDAAQSLLSLAGSYERSRLFPQARERAQRIIDEYPDTQAAIEARRILDRLDSR